MFPGMSSRMALLSILCGLSPCAGFAAHDYCADADGTPAFSVVLLPDTQYYSESHERSVINPTIFPPLTDAYTRQTQWIVDNRARYNIKHVIHLGDVTDNYENSSALQWNYAKDAQQVLDDATPAIPYTMVPGNHDYHRYDESPSRLKRNSLSEYRDRFGSPNTLKTFEAAGAKFAVLGLEFAPTKDTICWASDKASQLYDHWIIVATHCYLGRGGTATDCDDAYNITGADGETLWSELAARHPNIAYVVSGHINGSKHRCQSRACWPPVHEILTDYQREHYRYRNDEDAEHGGGWFRLLKFYPDKNKVNTCVITSLDDVTSFNRDSSDSDADDGNYYSSSPGHPDHKYTVTPIFNGPFRPLTPPNATPIPVRFFSDRALNTSSTGQQTYPSVAMNADGIWVAAWVDDQGPDGSYRIRARIFKPDGCQRQDEFTVSTGKVPTEPLLYGQSLIAGPYPIAPSIAINKDRFVVSWAERSDGKTLIKARGYYLDGSAAYSPKTVSQVTSSPRGRPKVGIDGYGRAAVVWHDEGSNVNGYYNIYMRQIDQNGFASVKPDGSPNIVVVNRQTDGNQTWPSIAVRANGNFVVVWQHDDGDVHRIMSRGFFPGGSNLFPTVETIVNTGTTGPQRHPAVAIRNDGIFIVAWEDRGSNAYYQIKRRGFNSDGTPHPTISQVTVNAVETRHQLWPSIAMATDGRHVIAWEDDSDGAEGIYEIVARRYDAGGVALSGNEIVNSIDSGQQQSPAITMSSNAYVVAWRDDLEKNSYYEVLSRGCEFERGCHPVSKGWAFKTIGTERCQNRPAFSACVATHSFQ